LDVADHIAALDRVFYEGGLLLVYGADHLALRDEHHPARRVVADDVAREVRLIPAGARAHEVNERDAEFEGGPKRAVVGLVGRPSPVRVEEAVLGLLVPVGRAVRRLNGERSRTPLHRRTKDALLGTQVRHTCPPEGKTSREASRIRNVLAELGAEDRQLPETRRPDVLVLHKPILGSRSTFSPKAERRLRGASASEVTRSCPVY
jgi:hypothetical protein